MLHQRERDGVARRDAEPLAGENESMSAEHTSDQIEQVLEAFTQVAKKQPVRD